MTQFRTKIWVNGLSTLVLNYNTTFHSTTRTTPTIIYNEWINGNDEFITKIAETIKENRLSAIQKYKKLTLDKLKSGDSVRLSLESIFPSYKKAKSSGIGKLAKHYIQNWTNEIFKVEKVKETKGFQYIKVEGKDKWFQRTDIQKIQPDELVNLISDQPPIQEVIFNREKHLKKLHQKKYKQKEYKIPSTNLSERQKRVRKENIQLQDFILGKEYQKITPPAANEEK